MPALEYLDRLRDSLSRKVGRREFLGGLCSVIALGMASACRRVVDGAVQSNGPDPFVTGTPSATGTPTGTPVPTAARADLPYKVYLPQLVSDSGPQGRAQSPSTATPTEAATRKPTRKPTSTPVPTPTPFPPGPPTKLGLFITHNHPQIVELVRTQNVAVIKTMSQDVDFLAELKAISPQTLFVGRVYVEQQLDLANVVPAEAARQMVNVLLPPATDPRLGPVFDAWEGHNEPVPVDSDQMKRLADVEAERVRLLAGEGVRSVIGNFGTGLPALELWPDFFPALQAAKEYQGLLGLHEYSAPEMQYGTHGDGEGWLTLRYRKAYRQYLIPAGLKVPLVMTECGVDGMIRDRPGPEGKGWKDFIVEWAKAGMGMDGPGNYIEQLAWYDSQLIQDDYVVGAAIFTMTTTREWQSYEILGEPATILQQYFSVHPPR